jgi:hypothetical protein
MKTTVDIPDSLFAEAKASAEVRGLTFRQVIEEGLRAVLDQQRRPARRFRLRDGSFGGRGRQAGLSWPEIRRSVYEGRGE